MCLLLPEHVQAIAGTSFPRYLFNVVKGTFPSNLAQRQLRKYQHHNYKYTESTF
jgi:hypothetical protein